MAEAKRRVSLTSQIAALDAIIDGRSLSLSPSARELQREHLKAALRTLRWMEIHATVIRRAVAESEERS